MTGCMISGWGNAARTGYGSKFEKLLMKGVVGYVDKKTCNEKHGEGLKHFYFKTIITICDLNIIFCMKISIIIINIIKCVDKS